MFIRRIIVLVSTAVLAALPAGSAQAAGAHALIQGSGSSWAANAVNQWIADVHASGLQVVFTSQGSAQGRKDYANNTVDFAVSDIGYQGTDPATGADDTSQGRGYAYLPIVGGGTSFPYQIRDHGQLVRNLRLSGQTLAKIFTNQITNWSDKEITADNNGRVLPSLPIIPVVHSEGSGSTYQFTRYLAKEYPSSWGPFGGGATEYFPRKGPQVAENGSDSVMNFISSGSANGAIGFDEYSYALGKNYPVAKVLNSAGYYTLPNQYNVAVALTRAQIDTVDKDDPSKYLLQNLDQVYTYRDSRVYPLSSYSYMIIPTSASDQKMTTAKRQTLADYLYYSLCQGQKEMGPIGYSPLPINLVSAGFQQTALLHTADSKVDLTSENVATCHNPTFVAGQPTRNYLAEIAPLPPGCDKQGAGPCTGSGDTGQANPTATGSSKGGSKSSSGTSGTSGSGGSSSGGSGSSGGAAPSTGRAGAAAGNAAGTGRAATAKSAAAPQLDPATGQLVSGDGSESADTGTVLGSATVLDASQSSGVNAGLSALAVLLLVCALVVPPLVSIQLRRRSGR